VCLPRHPPLAYLFLVRRMRVPGIAFFICFVVAADPPVAAAISEKDKKFMTNLADRGLEQIAIGTGQGIQARTRVRS
jgi:hypothetical protein